MSSQSSTSKPYVFVILVILISFVLFLIFRQWQQQSSSVTLKDDETINVMVNVHPLSLEKQRKNDPHFSSTSPFPTSKTPTTPHALGAPEFIIHPHEHGSIRFIINHLFSLASETQKCVLGRYPCDIHQVVYASKQLTNGIEYRIILRRGDRFVFLHVHESFSSTHDDHLSRFHIQKISIIQPIDFHTFLLV